MSLKCFPPFAEGRALQSRKEAHFSISDRAWKSSFTSSISWVGAETPVRCIQNGGTTVSVFRALSEIVCSDVETNYIHDTDDHRIMLWDI